MAGTRASGRLPAPPVPQLKPTTVLLCNNAQIQNTEYKNTNVQIQIHKQVWVNCAPLCVISQLKAMVASTTVLQYSNAES